MTSLQRVLTTLGHQEPDRVPLFLLLSLHGAKELGLSIEEYFSQAENVVEGQLRLREKFGHDCIYTFFYAPIEIEALGGEVIFREDGPPNSGRPVITDFQQIETLEYPEVRETPCLQKVLKATAMLKERVADEVPIIGVVMSPYSLPVMQLGFDRYFDLMYDEPDLFEQLMAVNKRFAVAWANAQIEAGATAITYFDPVSSPTISSREEYLRTGYPLAKQCLAEINGPVAIHLASGNTLPIIPDIVDCGAGVVAVSALEDLCALKESCRGRITILGNMNGITMRNWSAEEAEQQVKLALAKGGPGGGFLLGDNHGEIPWQVPDEVLLAIGAAVRKWGCYPLDWVEDFD